MNNKWYGDGTEIVTDEGKLHLASVLDMGSRRIVGFALSELNGRPRKTLGWKTPAEAFNEQLRSLEQTGVATTD